MYKVLGKRVMIGNNVSHANNKTKRTFDLNKISVSLFSYFLNKKIRLLTTVSLLRTINKYNGIDNFLVEYKNLDDNMFSKDLLTLKRRLLKAKLIADSEKPAASIEE